MSANGHRECRRHELELAADKLFDTIDPEDFTALLDRYGSRRTLRDAVVDRGEKVADKLATTDDPVIPDEDVRLIAACLTWVRNRNQAGVAQNTGHALKKFGRYRRFPDLPPEILVRVGRTDRDDDDRVIALLARSLRIRTGVTNARSAGEPELMLNMVVPAIVAALAQGPDQPLDPAADAALVGTALDVLERGAGLAVEYRVAGRPVPGVGDLPVVGNAYFLVEIAAYRLAIEERRGLAVTRPLDRLEPAVADLAGTLRKAMIRPANRLWGRHGPDESDVATALNQFASYLGSAARDTAARRRVSTVHTVLNYWLCLPEPPAVTLIEDPDVWGSSFSDGAHYADALSDVEYLVGWLLAAFFHGAGPDARQALLEWLNGTELTNQQKHLPLLVRRLRVAIARLDAVTTNLDGEPPTPPRPAGVTPGQFDAMAARLVASVDPGDINGCTRTGARLLTLAALPPLWTRRCPAIQLLAAHLRVLIGPGHSGPCKAMLIARHGVRAPLQFVQPSTSPPPVPCCPDEGAAGRPAAGGRPREPVDYQEICPHRPWGEIGFVENYHTLGRGAGFTAEAARKQLDRYKYKGPWPDLLWP